MRAISTALLLSLLTAPLAASWCSASCAMGPCGLDAAPAAPHDGPHDGAARRQASTATGEAAGHCPGHCPGHSHGTEPAQAEHPATDGDLSATTRPDCCVVSATVPAVEAAATAVRHESFSLALTVAPPLAASSATLDGVAQAPRPPPRLPPRPLLTLHSVWLI
jgi:hypothetical protein